MKKLIVQSAVLSRFSNKQTVMVDTVTGNKNSGSIISGEIKSLIKSLFKVESVHVYIMDHGSEIVIGREKETLMVGVPLGLSKDKVIAQVSEYLMDNKRSLVFRFIRFLGGLLKITKLSKYADAIVGVVEIVVDLFIFKEKQLGPKAGMGFKTDSAGHSMGASSDAIMVSHTNSNFTGKFSCPVNSDDYDRPLSDVRRLQTFKNSNHSHEK